MRALKNLLRTPLKSGVLFVLIAATSYLFISNAITLYNDSADLNTMLKYYVTTGTVRKKPEEGVNNAEHLLMQQISTQTAAKVLASPYIEAGDMRIMAPVVATDDTYLSFASSEYQSRKFGKVYYFEGVVEGELKEKKTVANHTLLIKTTKVLTQNINEIHVGDILQVGLPHYATIFDKDRWTYTDIVGNKCVFEKGKRYFFQMEIVIDEKYHKLYEVVDYAIPLENADANYLQNPKYIFCKDDNGIMLETSPYYRVNAYRDHVHGFSGLFTEDMRFVPAILSGNTFMSDGRALTHDDSVSGSRVCCISQVMALKYKFEVGDAISLKVQSADRGAWDNDMFYGMSLYCDPTKTWQSDAMDFTIVGIFNSDDFTDGGAEALSVNSIIMPLGVYKGLEQVKGYNHNTNGEAPRNILPLNFTFRLRSPFERDAFEKEVNRDLALAGQEVIIDDNGFSNVAPSIVSVRQSSRISFAISALAFVVTAMLIVYLYILRKNREYAIMRALGTSKLKSAIGITLPLLMLAVLAIALSGTVACFTGASGFAKLPLELMPKGFTPSNTVNPALAVIASVAVLAFIMALSCFALYKISRRSPLALLQQQKGGKAKKPKTPVLLAESTAHTVKLQPVKLETVKLSSMTTAVYHGKPRRGLTAQYILRHMRRNVLKSALTFLVCVVLIAAMGIYAFTLHEKTAQLEKLYKTVDIYMNVDHTKQGKFKKQLAEMVMESGLCKPYYMEAGGQSGVNYMSLSEKDFPMLSQLSGETSGRLIGLNDISQYSLVRQEYMNLEYMQGVDASIFSGGEKVCVLNGKFMELCNLKLGDKITMAMEWPEKQEYTGTTIFTKGAEMTIVGSYRLVGRYLTGEMYGNIFVPLETLLNTRDLFFDSSMPLYGDENSINSTYVTNEIQEIWMGYSHLSFKLIDNNQLPQLRKWIEGCSELQSRNRAVFVIDDTEFESTVIPLEQNVGLLEKLFPVAVAVACLLGGGIPGLIIIQSAKEAAVMRILGTTKRRTRLTLVLEQLALCLLGLLLGATTLLILHGAALAPVLPKLALCAGLYFGSCILATTLCATIVTRGKALELLQTKE